MFLSVIKKKNECKAKCPAVCFKYSSGALFFFFWSAYVGSFPVFEKREERKECDPCAVKLQTMS